MNFNLRLAPGNEPGIVERQAGRDENSRRRSVVCKIDQKPPDVDAGIT
jgi:hypothetical protein